MRLRTLVASTRQTFRSDLTRYVQLLDPCIEVIAEAATAGEVLAAVGELRPDLVLLDLSLWRGNALPLVTHIRRLSPDALAVVIGNQPAAEYREAAIAVGALDYVDVLEVGTMLPAALQRVPQLIACHERLRQTDEWTPPEAGPKEAPAVAPKVARLRPAHRGVLARVRRRLRTAPTGPKHGPYTAWQYVHLGLGTVLGQVILSLRHTPDVRIERCLLVLLLLAGITVLEARQFARAYRVAQVAGPASKPTTR